MLWAIHCLDKSNTKEARNEYRALHRSYLDKWDEKIFFSGPLENDDASEQIGSLFILAVSCREEARSFIDNETFNQQGIFESVKIYRLRSGRFHAENVQGEK